MWWQMEYEFKVGDLVEIYGEGLPGFLQGFIGRVTKIEGGYFTTTYTVTGKDDYWYAHADNLRLVEINHTRFKKWVK